jgi:rhamnose utilization protein RhaD (predicted bifunctional aldolase and dehydrogenase)
MSEIKNLIEMSKYAGERFDLVQAGGGNSSVKIKNGEMLIKASGFLLSDMSISNGYARVNFKKIANIVKKQIIINESSKRKRESLTSNLVQDATLDKNNRPSIETLLHSFLYKYTLHTHPVVVNMVVVQKNWKKILSSIFKDQDIALVPYKTPGIELALELDKTLKNFKKIPNIIFLQNHGLIVTSDNNEDIKFFVEQALEKIEEYLSLDMSRYKLTNKISQLNNALDSSSSISYLSDDVYLNKQLLLNKELFLKKPFCPDTFVFCGFNAITIKNFSDNAAFKNYKKKHFEFPKVVIFEDNLFFIASNVKKAKEMEEVMKFHIMVLEKSSGSDKNFLDSKEMAYLGNWEAEKYRQK